MIFTDPQVAAVGLTLAGALERGIEARAYDVASRHGRRELRRPRHARARRGSSSTSARGVLVGATFVGIEVAEWLHAATIAIVGEVPIERLWHAVPAFPTRSEIWLKLLERREADLLQALTLRTPRRRRPPSTASGPDPPRRSRPRATAARRAGRPAEARPAASLLRQRSRSGTRARRTLVRWPPRGRSMRAAVGLGWAKSK